MGFELSRPGPEEPQSLGVRVERFGARRDGIVTTEQLHGLGLSDSRISDWVKAGRLFDQHRGVFSVGREELTRRGTWRAALAAVGDDAWLSHRSAAENWGWLATTSTPVDVTTTRRLRQRDGIRLHFALEPPPALTLNGFLTTRAPRTIADCAAFLDEAELLSLFSTAAYRKCLSHRDLLPEIVPNRPGVERLRRLVATMQMGAGLTHTELEHAFRRLVQRHRITPPSFNHAFRIDGREIVADALWLEQRLVVELDSRLAHGDEVSLFNDGVKNLLYEELGLNCLRLTTWHVVQNELRTAKALASRVGRI